MCVAMEAACNVPLGDYTWIHFRLVQRKPCDRDEGMFLYRIVKIDYFSLQRFLTKPVLQFQTFLSHHVAVPRIFSRTENKITSKLKAHVRVTDLFHLKSIIFRYYPNVCKSKMGVTINCG